MILAMIRYLALAIVAVALATAPSPGLDHVHAQASPPAPTHNKEQQRGLAEHQAGNHQGARTSRAVNEAGPTRPEGGKPAGNTDEKDGEAYYEALTAYSTLALAVLTLALVGVGGWVGCNQIKIMADQRRLMEGELTAARDAATGALRAAQAAEDSNTKLQRGWVLIEPGVLKGWPPQSIDPGNFRPFVVTLEWFWNHCGGTLVQIESGSVAELEVFRGELPDEPPYNTTARGVPVRPVRQGVRDPGDTARLAISDYETCKALLTHEDNARIVFFGVLLYRDIFDAPHESRFCFEVAQLGVALPPGDDGWRVRYCVNKPRWTRIT